MEQFNKVIAQLRELWSKMGGMARAVSVATVIVAALAIAALALASRPSYRVLYSGLEGKDAAAVVAALDAAKVRHRIAGGGAIIEVDAAEVDRARLMLAEQGLPRGGSVGLQELFDEPKFGRTRFDQRVMYMRGMQGELERTIGRIDAVNEARIHLSLPDKAVFEDERVPATAAVTLRLMRGRSLSESSVSAIQHLTAAAVEGLEVENVTVVDTEGTLLSRAGSDPRAAASLDYKHDLERRLEGEVTRLLERTVGAGGVHVSVAAEVDFAQVETTEEIYDPEQTAIRSEATQEAYEGPAEKRAQGLAGAPANEPGAATAGNAGTGASASRLVNSKNYEVNRTVVHTLGPSAQVKRLSVSVLVDGSWTTPEDGGAPVYLARPPEEITQLQQVVENAVGFNAARGDRISLASVPFVDRPRLADIDEGAATAAPAWLPLAGGAAALALILGGVAFFVLRRRRGAPAVAAQVLQYPTSVSEAQRAIQAIGNAQGALPPGAVEATEPGQLASLQGAQQLRSAVIEASEADPERTAEIIRAWMSQEAA